MQALLEAVGLGLVILLPLANPLTAIALFLSLSSEMNFHERNRQSVQASFYVFTIMVVAWYAGNAVLNTFGISIPGLRIAGGLIVAFIGFRMLFPAQAVGQLVEARYKQDELDQGDVRHETVNIAFVPLAMPGTAGPGTIAIIISTASTVKSGVDFPAWVISIAPVITFFIVSLTLWLALRSSGTIMKLLGKSGIQAISRLMGFLLVCMGVQFVINGVLEVAHNLH